jgi:hypothetical protein
MVQNRKTRFLVAVGVSLLALLLVFYRLFGIQGFTPSAYGTWIPLYPHPLEVMLLTTLMLGVWLWMYLWYRRDRVQQTLATLNAEERRQLLDHLTLEAADRLMLDNDGEYSTPIVSPRKRKRDGV